MLDTVRQAFRRKVTIALAAAAIATVGVGAAVEAGQYWSTGSLGPATVPQGVCKYYPVWGRLDAAINPPTIYARNSTSARDAQWVRYRVFVVDGTGRTVRASNYSAFVLAYDNAPAAFSGATLFTNIPNNSKLDVRVEWWNSTSQVGALAFRVDSYQHYSGMVGPYGPISGCATW